MKSLLRRAVRVDFDLEEDGRYVGVGICSGLMNLAVFSALFYGLGHDNWHAKVASAIVGGTIGYWGHELFSFGRHQSTLCWWKRMPKFLFGMFINGGVFLGVSWLLYQIDWMPHLGVQIGAMAIGFLFFRQWNKKFTFDEPEASTTPTTDSPAVACVEHS